MTIKEIEALTGMTRANIRFYENEGLISPNRNSNGYRDYSAQDTIPKVQAPWRRFFARTLDEVLYSCIWNLLLILVFRVNISNMGTGGNILDIFLSETMMTESLHIMKQWQEPVRYCGTAVVFEFRYSICIAIGSVTKLVQMAVHFHGNMTAH